METIAALEERVRELESENDLLARQNEFLMRRVTNGATERGRMYALLGVVFDALQKAAPEEAAPFEADVAEWGLFA